MNAIICPDKDAAHSGHDVPGFPVIRSIDQRDQKIDLAGSGGAELELLIMKDRPAGVKEPDAYGDCRSLWRTQRLAAVPCKPIRKDACTGKTGDVLPGAGRAADRNTRVRHAS